MALIGGRALCIRKVEYSETSQILSLFTREHGLVRVIAKGAHRATKAGASKFDGGLDLLDEGEALFTDRLEKDLNILTEWKLVDGHRVARANLRAIYLGLYAAEIVDKLFEVRDPHPVVFDRLAISIDLLATPACEEVALALVLDLMHESGFMPALDLCSNCGRPITGSERTVFFSLERGGVVCERCETQVPGRRPVNPKLIGIAINVSRLPRDKGVALRLPRLTRVQTDPLQAMFARHIMQTTQQNLRLARFIVPWKRPASPPSPGTPGGGRGEGSATTSTPIQNPPPGPLPEYREREPST